MIGTIQTQIASKKFHWLYISRKPTDESLELD